MGATMTVGQTARMLSISPETLRRWDNTGRLRAERNPSNKYRYYHKDHINELVLSDSAHPKTDYGKRIKNGFYGIELFAGAGGLALGLEKAGFSHLLLNDFDRYATATLKKNRPDWNVIHGDVADMDFTSYAGKTDILTGGFPCQAFSYAGKKLGLEDTRGTLFYEFARALKESQPKVFLAENVRGLLTHDKGRTLQTMIDVFKSMGYKVLEPKVLKAIHYRVPQKRERLFLVGIKEEYASHVKFRWPTPCNKIYTIKDALKKGELYETDVPPSPGQQYPEKKKKVLDLVPPGGYWRDLPIEIQKEYMMKSFFLGGGKTGIARRISWDEPSLTLTCSPAQKQTERCHPDHTRPFQIREYARIQTFPDEWIFEGSITQQYKQIGNAVPVNLAYEIGLSLSELLKEIRNLDHA